MPKNTVFIVLSVLHCIVAVKGSFKYYKIVIIYKNVISYKMIKLPFKLRCLLTFRWEVRTWGFRATRNRRLDRGLKAERSDFTKITRSIPKLPKSGHSVFYLYSVWSPEQRIQGFRKRSKSCCPRGFVLKNRNPPGGIFFTVKESYF